MTTSRLGRRLLPLGLALLAWSSLTLPAAGQRTPANPDPELVEEVDEYAVPSVYDPLEPVNRAIFAFNEGAYRYALRPLARGYVKVVPRPVRTGIGNVFDNLRYPVRAVNSLFQGKPRQVARETGKFVVNTVVGVGGIGKPSERIPALADVPAEDTGQTFGVWGIGRGPYLVLPLFGAGTARDTVGLVGDYFLNPLSWGLLERSSNYDWTWDAVPAAVNGVNSVPGILDAYDAARRDAVDPYVAIRSAYVQYRDAAVRQ